MELVIVGIILGVAACVQGAIGFGLGMLAAPLLALIAPDLLPGTILLLAFVLSTATFLRERGEIEWRVVAWTIVGRIPGSLIGALLVAVLPTSGLTLVLAVAVLLGIVVSLVGWRPGYGATSSSVAGFAAGILGTSTSIGGPPLALILRDLPPARVRGTMGAAFIVGSTISVVLLAISGSLSAYQWRSALILLPAVIVGFLLSSLVNRHIDSKRLYVGSVALSVLGAGVVIIKSVSELLA